MLRDDVQELLNLLQQLEVPDLADLSPEQGRKLLEDLKPDKSELRPVHSIENIGFDGPEGTIKVRVFTPAPRPGNRDPLPALVWYHGGGWVLGDLDSAEVPGRDLAEMANCIVVAPDYRLAPEHRFPAAFDDSMATLKWVMEEGETFGIDTNRIAVGGDSAGGNLAACVAVAAAAEGIPLAYQLLIYPVVEADFHNGSYNDNAEGYFLTRSAMEYFWAHYVPSEDDRDDPRVRPLSGDLSGTAPAWVYTAEYDPLRDEGRKLADALEKAGVPVTRVQADGAIHGVFTFTIPTGSEARALAADALSAAFSSAAQ